MNPESQNLTPSEETNVANSSTLENPTPTLTDEQKARLEEPVHLDTHDMQIKFKTDMATMIEKMA